MNVIFEYHDVSGSPRLEAMATEKLNKLEEKYPFVIRGDVFFKKENVSDNTGHICGVRLSAPGPRLFASSDKENFMDALSESIRELEQQLKKRKDKMQTH